MIMEATSFSRLKTGFFVVTHILFCIKVINRCFYSLKRFIYLQFWGILRICRICYKRLVRHRFWVFLDLTKKDFKKWNKFLLELFTRHDWKLKPWVLFGYNVNDWLKIQFIWHSYHKMQCKKMQNVLVESMTLNKAQFRSCRICPLLIRNLIEI